MTVSRYSAFKARSKMFFTPLGICKLLIFRLVSFQRGYVAGIQIKHGALFILASLTLTERIIFPICFKVLIGHGRVGILHLCRSVAQAKPRSRFVIAPGDESSRITGVDHSISAQAPHQAGRFIPGKIAIRIGTLEAYIASGCRQTAGCRGSLHRGRGQTALHRGIGKTAEQASRILPFYFVYDVSGVIGQQIAQADMIRRIVFPVGTASGNERVLRRSG